MTTRYVHIGGVPTAPDWESLIKYDEDGVEQWAIDPGYVTALQHEWIEAVAVDPSGFVYSAGSYGSDTQQTYKHTPAGVLVWGQHLLHSSWSNGIAVSPTTGHVAEAHLRVDSDGGEGLVSVSLLDGSDGSALWRKDTGATTLSVAFDSAGAIYVGGLRTSSKSVWKYTAAGAVTWFADTGHDVYAVAVDPTGQFLYVTGRALDAKVVHKLQTSDGAEIVAGNWPLVIAGYDAFDYVTGVCCDLAGNIYTTDDYYDGDGYNWVRAFNSAGAALWATVWAGDAHGIQIAVSPSGYVYVVGEPDAYPGANAAHKYDASTGAEVTTGNWPLGAVAELWGLAVSPGCVGAFPGPGGWMPAPNIYVGDVDYDRPTGGGIHVGEVDYE